jgi:hypothetical protein
MQKAASTGAAQMHSALLLFKAKHPAANLCRPSNSASAAAVHMLWWLVLIVG